MQHSAAHEWPPPFHAIRLRIREFLNLKKINNAVFVETSTPHICENNTYFLIHDAGRERFQFHVFLEQTPTLRSPDATVIVIQFLHPHPSAWFRLTSETEIEKFLRYFEKVLDSAPPPPSALPPLPTSRQLPPPSRQPPPAQGQPARKSAADVIRAGSAASPTSWANFMAFSSPYNNTSLPDDTITTTLQDNLDSRYAISSKKAKPMSAIMKPFFANSLEESLAKTIRKYFSTKQRIELPTFLRGHDGAIHINHENTNPRIPISFSVQPGGGGTVTFYGDKKLHFWADDDEDDDDACITCIRQFFEGQVAFVA
jgi:hypothetical protein